MSVDLRPGAPPQPSHTPAGASLAGNASPPAGWRLFLIWFPVIAAVAVALLLLPRLLDYAQHSWQMVWFPWQIDFDEGINAHASWLLSQGTNIYRPNPSGHFVSAMYPPLYFALNAAAMKVWGLNLASGRLLALLGALAVGAGLWWWVYSETRKHAAGAVAALLWLGLGPVYVWSTFYKQDLPALALGVVGGALAAGGFARRQPEAAGNRLIWLALVPLVLSFWMKQSSLAPPAAVGVALLLRDRRLAVRWGLWAAGAILLPFAALDLLLKGGLHTHVLAFDHYGRSADRLARNTERLWVEHWPLVLLGAAFVVACLLVAVARRRLDALPLSALYLAVATPAALLSNSLPTANYNHLLDLLAPLCLTAGSALGWAWSLPARTGRFAWGRLAAAAALPALVLWQAVLMVGTPPRYWYTPLGISFEERAARMEKLSEEIAKAPGDILSEDNWLLMKNGKNVIYDDPAAMAALANAGAWDQSTLLSDIERRKFSLVLLQYDLTTETYNPRWTEQALAALKANYEVRFRDVLYAHAPRPAPTQAETAVDCSEMGGAIFEGYTFRAHTANPGDPLPLSVYWSAGGGPPDPGLKYFVRLLDPSGAPAWSADLVPGEAAGKPLSGAWSASGVVRDDLNPSLKGDAPPGRYRLQFGLYSVESGGGITPRRAECRGSLAPDGDGVFTLAEVDVSKR